MVTKAGRGTNGNKSELGDKMCSDVRRLWRLVAALMKAGASRAETINNSRRHNNEASKRRDPRQNLLQIYFQDPSWVAFRSLWRRYGRNKTGVWLHEGGEFENLH